MWLQHLNLDQVSTSPSDKAILVEFNNSNKSKLNVMTSELKSIIDQTKDMRN